jgi:hypothetical protein
MRSIASTALRTTSARLLGVLAGSSDQLAGFLGALGGGLTAAVISSTAAAVSSTEAACCSARFDRSSAAALISSEPE